MLTADAVFERVEAVARALSDAKHNPCWYDDCTPEERDSFRGIARHALRAADAVDPFRHRDTAVRFPALAAATNAALDEIIGIAEEYIGERVET